MQSAKTAAYRRNFAERWNLFELPYRKKLLVES